MTKPQALFFFYYRWILYNIPLDYMYIMIQALVLRYTWYIEMLLATINQSLDKQGKVIDNCALNDETL